MLHSLNVAQTGLSTSQTQVESVMNNIANENTPGYKKRVVNTVELEHNDSRVTGRGVQVVDVSRITNIYMYDNLSKENSKKSYLNELDTMLSDIESIFHETNNSGMSYYLEQFFNSLENLRTNPNDEIYKSNVAENGKILVDELKNIYSQIEERENISLSFLKDDVSSLNEIVQDIGKVNQQLVNSLKQSNDLLDKRDLLQDRMSKYVDVKVDRSDESYTLNAGGLAVVRYNTNIHEINVKEDYIAQKDIFADINNNSNLINSSTWDGSDSVTVYINKDFSISVTNGEIMKESDYNYDLNGDGTIDDTDVTINKDNVVRAVVAKINNDPDISKLVKAYNGNYYIDSNGNKQDKTDQDYYLVIESKTTGEKSNFTTDIFVNDDDNSNSDGEQVLYKVEKNSNRSKIATNDIHLEIFNNEVPVNSGKDKAILENIDTTNPNNKFTKYKNMLDNFARKLSDLMDSYIFLGDKANDRRGDYVYGKEASLLHPDRTKKKDINLFSGSSVKSLVFNENKVGELTQEKLDYLSALRWKQDIDFDGNGGKNSLTSYYKSIRVTVANDKESTSYLKENQESVFNALKLSYDKLTKVNKDDEMINLIKFQRAYEANAKIITTIDRMLQTLLGLKQ